MTAGARCRGVGSDGVDALSMRASGSSPSGGFGHEEVERVQSVRARRLQHVVSHLPELVVRPRPDRRMWAEKPSYIRLHVCAPPEVAVGIGALFVRINTTGGLLNVI